MITAQAIAERGMLEALVSGVMGIPQALDARLGAGNGKWIIAAALVIFLIWALKPRR
jgi:hypothetical protein